ncbi:MAG: redoxin domain-containing protein [bacterium]|nr:redoxin domain-containing protein [bacterium]
MQNFASRLFIFVFYLGLSCSLALAEIKPVIVRSLDGKEVLVGDKNDKPQLIFILATRCPVSNAYNQRMEAIAQDYKDQLIIVGVNPNETESDEEVKNHSVTNQFSFPIYRDPEFKLVNSWKVKVTPEVFLIDTNGKLIYRGRIDDNQEVDKVKSNDLRNAIEKLIHGKAVNGIETRPFGCTIKRISK